MKNPDVDAALRRILVELERPAALDEWRHPVPRGARAGAVSVTDKHGHELRKVA